MASNNYYHNGVTQSNNANTKRVYLNPNFHRNKPMHQTATMYVNPLFPQSQVAPINTINKPKIFVNPNFVRKSNPSVNSMNNHNEVFNSYTPYLSNTPSTSTYTPPVVQKTVFEAPQLFNIVAKSRYSLVRRNTAASKINVTQSTENVTSSSTTFKVNKYKSVSLQQLMKDKQRDKNNLEYMLASRSNAQKTENVKKCSSSKLYKSRFKFIKQNSVSSSKNESKPSVTRRHSLNNLNRSKTRLRTGQKVKIKIDRTKLKKNNIPCSLFRKYGTCLRRDKGHCEFLHDKKHVAICRKFLKGLCHNKSCLLSHEVTAEKMPTCSFYLKGMCTKDDCPYLHVKLNEKTKVCTDFLKGYCDKGDTCLSRHINSCPDLASNGVCLQKTCPYPHQINRKLKVLKCVKSTHRPRHKKINNNQDKDIGKAGNSEMDHRYYKAGESNSPEVENIKPTRCKLGTLPSYIQL